MLEGPYDQNTSWMHDSLRIKGLIPNSEPFTALGFTHVGSGNETLDPALLLVEGKNAIVDWVFVEVRDKNNASNVLETKVGLLQRDGDVVDENGIRRLLFSVAEDDHFIALRHRNHLGVMTLNTIALGPNETTVDLSDPLMDTYGSEARTIVGNKALFWSGDVNADAVIKYTGVNNDRDLILFHIGGTIPTNTTMGYFGEDLNMDGEIKYTGVENDRDLILIGIGGVVPTNVRLEQLP